MKMIKQNERKLANILVNSGKYGDDYKLYLTDVMRFGFDDFSFEFENTFLRYFGNNELIWKCVDYVAEDGINKIQPAFDKLREILIDLKCMSEGTEDES